MHQKSRFIYFIFLWFTVSSTSGIFFYSFLELFVYGSGKILIWINPLLIVTGFIAVLIIYQKILNLIFKILLTIVSSCLIIFTSKYILIIFSGNSFQTVNNWFLAVVSVILSSLQIITAYIFCGQFMSIYKLLSAENKYRTPGDFSHQLSVRIGDNPKIVEIKRIIGTIINFFIINLLLSFLTIAKDTGSNIILSIYFMLFFIGCTGIYMIVHQSVVITKWRINNIELNSGLVKNWNRMIIMLIGIVLAIPFIFPWNFSIFNIKKMTEWIVNLFSGISINLVKDETVRNENSFGLPVFKPIPEELLSKLMLYIKYILLLIISFCATYLILGIIGGILFIFYKYKKKNRFIQFFINRYISIKWLFDFFRDCYINIREIVLFILFKKSKEIKKSQLEKQLLSFFDSYKKISEEKMEEIQSIIREFIRFIEAASRKIIPYYYYYGPKEYLDKVAKEIPELETNLDNICNIFNESRYSKRLLNQEKKEHFRTEIDYVIHFIDKILYASKTRL